MECDTDDNDRYPCYLRVETRECFREESNERLDRVTRVSRDSVKCGNIMSGVNKHLNV